LNPRPVDRKSDALPVAPPRHRFADIRHFFRGKNSPGDHHVETLLIISSWREPLYERMLLQQVAYAGYNRRDGLLASSEYATD